MNTPSEEKVSSGVKDGSSAGEVTQGVTRGGGRVRRATFADLDAILDINDNIYDGLDYMPAYFYIFMHSKDYAMYVFELDGQLVGYGIFSPSVNFNAHVYTIIIYTAWLPWLLSILS